MIRIRSCARVSHVDKDAFARTYEASALFSVAPQVVDALHCKRVALDGLAERDTVPLPIDSRLRVVRFDLDWNITTGYPYQEPQLCLDR